MANLFHSNSSVSPSCRFRSKKHKMRGGVWSVAHDFMTQLLNYQNGKMVGIVWLIVAIYRHTHTHQTPRELHELQDCKRKDELEIQVALFKRIQNVYGFACDRNSNILWAFVFTRSFNESKSRKKRTKRIKKRIRESRRFPSSPSLPSTVRIESSQILCRGKITETHRSRIAERAREDEREREKRHSIIIGIRNTYTVSTFNTAQNTSVYQPLEA